MKKIVQLSLLLTTFLAPLNLKAQSGVSEDASSELSVNDYRTARGLSDLKTVFVPKGQWIFGGTGSYSVHSNEDYTFLLIEDINSVGYNVGFSPLATYTYADNMSAGMRFAYNRNLMKIDNASIKIGDDESGVELGVNNFHSVTQKFSGMAIMRQYIPLGQSKRFALFNEIQLEVGGSTSRFTYDSPVKGTYARSLDLGIGITPGIAAFATNNVAVELNIGVLGLSYSKTKQVHNQVYVGELENTLMNFKINIFSIGFGVAIYL